MDYSPPGYTVHGIPSKNTGVGSHALSQGIFPTQGLNPGRPHCRQIIYHLSHQGSPNQLYFNLKKKKNSKTLRSWKIDSHGSCVKYCITQHRTNYQLNTTFLLKCCTEDHPRCNCRGKICTLHSLFLLFVVKVIFLPWCSKTFPCVVLTFCLFHVLPAKYIQNVLRPYKVWEIKLTKAKMLMVWQITLSRSINEECFGQ